ncbi:hypothetical protein QNI23_016640 [Bermanella sp. WJH001]|uniref:hypothetical protein n=1 Tax=Bermanella sp. WJH001 TaxID=3048005 RepID=UPI0024BE5A19|nr:hypothetical protein [Bermanella sp. WJH001]MDJ1538928.1 hypothetical protein [Bermanella sp. WJH001]
MNEQKSNAIKENYDIKINTLIQYLKDNSIEIDEPTESEKEESFTKLYYSTALNLAGLSKKENLIISKIHAELCNLKGVFYDTKDNRKRLEDVTGYSRSMINKAMQALNKKIALLKNTPPIIPIKTYSVKGKELPNGFIINPYLYSFGSWFETKKRRLIIKLVFSEQTQDLEYSIRQEDEQTGEIILDSECFDLNKVLNDINSNNKNK